MGHMTISPSVMWILDYYPITLENKEMENKAISYIYVFKSEV